MVAIPIPVLVMLSDLVLSNLININNNNYCPEVEGVLIVLECGSVHGCCVILELAS